MQNSSSTRRLTVCITGSNKGIGYATLDALLGQAQPYQLIMTSRSVQRGNQAITKLKYKHPSKQAPVCLELDLLSKDSVNAFIKKLKDTNTKLDILINNAGIYKVHSSTLKNFHDHWFTNYANMKLLTDSFITNNLLNNSGKIIFVSSGYGKFRQLRSLNPSVYDRFKEYRTMDRKELEELEELCVADHENGRMNKWPSMFYCSSKIFMCAYASVLGRELAGRNIQCYSMCPGFCNTDMTRGTGAVRTAAKGAETAVFLAGMRGDVDGKLQGEFFYDMAHSSLL